MSEDLCRLCLSTTNLEPIFVDTTQNKEYTKILTLTTGLLIKLHDGLPQNICSYCTEQINSGLNFRNQCQTSETKLLEIGFKKLRKGAKSDTKKKEKKLTNKTSNDDSKLYVDDHSMGIGLHEFEIEVEFDRITSNIEDKTEMLPSPDIFESNASNIVENLPDSAEAPPNRAQNPIEKKLTRKEKREAFLRLVDGVLDPKGPVKCKVCKKSYNGWPSFVSHTKLHLGFKYVCEYCGKSFISSTQLNRHCRSHHGMSRDLRCRHCDYLALDKPQLQLHERRVHTGERPFVCDQCSASYYSRRCLIQHIESHQTSSNVQCEQCPQRFKSRRHLSRHTYSAHTSKRYSYKCPVCSQVYRNCKYIRVHLKKQHSLTSKEAKIIKIKL